MSRISKKLTEKILRCEHKIVSDSYYEHDYNYIATSWSVLGLLHNDKDIYEIRYAGNIVMAQDNETYATFNILPTDADSFNIEADIIHVAVKISREGVLIRL